MAEKESTSHSHVSSQKHGQRLGPEEQRMQGHWLLASMGKKVLRPGGRELTNELLSKLTINSDSRIIEFGPGVGHTAARLLEKNPKTYTAVDRDQEGTAQVKKLFENYPQTKYVSADAKESGLPDECATLVIGEAMLTMQTDKGKRAIISEAARMLEPGGIYAIHELAFVPDSCPPEVQESVAAQLRKTIKVGARPLTVADWSELLKELGFEIEFTTTKPMALLEPKRIISDEGLKGALGFFKNVASNPPARKRIIAMRKTFTQHKENLAGVGIVARKK
ncbi:MAG: class I SAM-dependent methyltransferase [Actinomycetaceae bacterium]|nr:class I SAM-dependent methyltransferase [Actinomycetaceae bacterium]